MESKNKNSCKDDTDSMYMDSWDSIKAEFNNILQNEFNINPEAPTEFDNLSADKADISSALMSNGIGFSTIQNAILKNINNNENPETEKNWNGLASSLIKEHSHLLQDSQPPNTENLQKQQQTTSLSKPGFPHPAGNNNEVSNQFTPFSINTEHFLPFNPTSINHIEESLHNLRTQTNEQSLAGWQGEIYNGLNLINVYYQCYYKLQGTLALTIPKATVNFKERISQEIPGQDEKFSITDLYYLWLDSCEEAYLVITASEEFSLHIGELVNTYSQLRIATGNFTENVSTFTGLPTQKDLDSSYHEQYVLRKQQHSIKEELQSIQYQRELDNKANSAKIDNLTSEIEILKQQISQLKGLLDDSHSSSTSAKHADKNNDNMH